MEHDEVGLELPTKIPDPIPCSIKFKWTKSPKTNERPNGRFSTFDIYSLENATLLFCLRKIVIQKNVIKIY